MSEGLREGLRERLRERCETFERVLRAVGRMRYAERAEPLLLRIIDKYGTGWSVRYLTYGGSTRGLDIPYFRSCTGVRAWMRTNPEDPTEIRACGTKKWFSNNGFLVRTEYIVGHSGCASC